MNKPEIAQYLVNLHTLLEAQRASSFGEPSAIVAAEYDRYWTLLKAQIQKENLNETRP